MPNEHYQGADLVGTGNGRILGLFSGEAHILDFDPSAPSEGSIRAVGTGLGSPWALAQWEGRVWLFSPASEGSKLQAFDLETGALTQLSEDIGVRVVGAAASTCVPYEPAG